MQNVMVVDDEEIIRLTTSLMLKKLGISSVVEENGMKALAYFKEHGDEIDLIILDSHMPEISGIELFHKIREIDSKVCIAVSSGFVDSAEREEFENIGMCGLLAKPFAVSDLKGLLESVESHLHE